MGRTFVGIGFGPIQSGLFLLEAHASKNFDRLVVAEVVPETVAAVQKSDGRFRVNVAKSDGIESHEVTGVEIYNPFDRAGADQLIPLVTGDERLAPCAAEKVLTYAVGRGFSVDDANALKDVLAATTASGKGLRGLFASAALSESFKNRRAVGE